MNNYIKKNYLLYLIALFLLAINTISAQSYNCGVGLEQHTPITTNGTTGINFERAYKWTAPIDYPNVT